MTPPSPPRPATGPQIGLGRGTLIVMAAEAIAFPAGLAVTILLTRYLSADLYGTLALGLAVIAWLEWTVVSLFSRAAYKLVAEPDDWQGVAAAVVRTFTVAGVLTGAIVFAAAGPVAAAFGAPALAGLLRVLAVDVPLFAAAQGWRTVLVGRGRHGARAGVAATRWTARAGLIALGVVLGLPLPGIAAMIVAATVVELAVVRWRVGGGVRIAAATSVSVRRLLAFAAPLAASAICMRLFDRLDIFAIRLLGSPLEIVGAYGVAQNLALAPSLLGGAFIPALIAALSYRLAAGDSAGARTTAGAGLRVALLMLPLAAVAAGGAPVIVETLFGAQYAAAAPLFAALVIGAVGAIVLGVANGILVAAGRPRWTVAVTAPMLPVAALGHLLLIPRMGATGAAIVTAATAIAGAIAGSIAAHRLTGAPLPVATLARTVVVGAASWWAAAALLPGPGVAGLAGVCALGLASAGALAATGEATARERAQVRRAIAALRARRRYA